MSIESRVFLNHKATKNTKRRKGTAGLSNECQVKKLVTRSSLLDTFFPFVLLRVLCVFVLK